MSIKGLQPDKSYGAELTSLIGQELRGYDRYSLIKEYIQNADDAKATYLKVVLDERTHPGSLPNKEEDCVLGPALLFYNNSAFTDEDFVNIRRIMSPGKLQSAAKTGRFGRGFISSYNITDYPSFISGDTAIWMDPCRVTIAKEFQNPIAVLTISEMDGSYRPWLNTFKSAGDFSPESLPYSGTIFRLPLRTREQAEQSDISHEQFEISDFDKLVTSFRDLGPAAMLFLRHLLKIEITRIDKHGVEKELYSINTLNRDEVLQARQPLLDATEGAATNRIQAWLSSARIELPVARYRHDFLVTDVGKSEEISWAIVNGLFRGRQNSLLQSALNVCQSKNKEKAIPWAGAAVPIRDGQPVPSDGGWSCFLPIQESSTWPVWLHGWFDLDDKRHDRTTKLGGDKSTETRVKWNEVLLREGIAQAWVMLLDMVKGDAVNTTAPYLMWPKSEWSDVKDLDRHLVRGFYKAASHFSLIRVQHSSGFSWNQPTLGVWQLGARETHLYEALLTHYQIVVPPLPNIVRKYLEREKSPVQQLDPERLRKSLAQIELDSEGVALAGAPIAMLRRKEWVLAVSKFCADGEVHQLRNLPLCLSKDGQLRTVGEHAYVLPSASIDKLLAPWPQLILDEDLAHTLMPEQKECPGLMWSEPTLQNVAELITLIFDPEDKAFGHDWFKDFDQYICEHTEPEVRDASDSLKRLPCLHTQQDKWLQPSDPNFFVPSKFTPPGIGKSVIQLVSRSDERRIKVALWLDVPEMNRKEYVQKLLIPSIRDTEDIEEQLTALRWLRERWGGLRSEFDLDADFGMYLEVIRSTKFLPLEDGTLGSPKHTYGLDFLGTDEEDLLTSFDITPPRLHPKFNSKIAHDSWNSFFKDDLLLPDKLQGVDFYDLASRLDASSRDRESNRNFVRLHGLSRKLFRYMTRHWMHVRSESIDDTDLLTLLNNLEWLPASRPKASKARYVVYSSEIEDKLYCPHELYSPQLGTLVSGVAPVLDADSKSLPADFVQELDVRTRVSLPDAVENFRELMQCEFGAHDRLTESVIRFYELLGLHSVGANAHSAKSTTLLLKLKNSILTRQGWRNPARVFRNVPTKIHGVDMFDIPTPKGMERDSIFDGLKMLGVQDNPSAKTYADILNEIASRFDGKPLHFNAVEQVGQLHRLLASFPDAIEAKTQVLTHDDRLVHASNAINPDDGRLDHLDWDKSLPFVKKSPNNIQIASLGGAKSLKEHLYASLDQLSNADEYAADSEALNSVIQHELFVDGLIRLILEHHDEIPDWRSASVTILGQLHVKYWFRNEPNSLFVASKDGTAIRNGLQFWLRSSTPEDMVDELAEQISQALDISGRSTVIMRMLSARPEDIEHLLDQKMVGSLPSPGLEDDPAPDVLESEDDDFLEEDSFADESHLPDEGADEGADDRAEVSQPDQVQKADVSLDDDHRVEDARTHDSENPPQVHVTGSADEPRQETFSKAAPAVKGGHRDDDNTSPQRPLKARRRHSGATQSSGPSSPDQSAGALESSANSKGSKGRPAASSKHGGRRSGNGSSTKPLSGSPSPPLTPGDGRPAKSSHNSGGDKQSSSWRVPIQVLPPSTGDSERDYDNEKTETGVRGERFIQAFEEERGWTAKIMPPNHPGYDIVSTNPDTGEFRYIEVKASKGHWDEVGVSVTATQAKCALESASQGIEWWLYVVEYINDAKQRRVYPVPNPFIYGDTRYLIGDGWQQLAFNEDGGSAATSDDVSPEIGQLYRVDDGVEQVTVTIERIARSGMLLVRMPDGSIRPKRFNPQTWARCDG